MVSTLSFWLVSTHSRPKAAALSIRRLQSRIGFQHTAARRRLFGFADFQFFLLKFQHTAARRRLDSLINSSAVSINVSTHSRPKAAEAKQTSITLITSFQHTAARRRLTCRTAFKYPAKGFQHTAARRRLWVINQVLHRVNRFNTQPPEGGCFEHFTKGVEVKVSTHSRPKAAANADYSIPV